MSLILSGAHVTDSDLESFSSAYIELRESVFWVRRTGVTIGTGSSGQPGSLSIAYTPPEVAATQTTMGKLELSIGAEFQRTISDVQITESCSFGIQFSEPMGLQAAVAPLTAIRDLVTIAIDAPSSVRSMALSRSGVERDQLELYARLAGGVDGSESVDDFPAGMLFTFDDIGGLDGVAQWLTIAERFAPVVRFLVSHWYFPEAYTQNRFLNIVIAAEALERIRTGKQDSPLKQALLQIAADVGGAATALVGDIADWADEVVKMRVVDVVHLGLGGNVDGTRMFILSESVYILVIMSLLRECGVPEGTLSNLKNHQRFQWVALQLQGT